MAEHDQRFTKLLKEFLPEFFQGFFPQRAAGLDFDGLEWLDKEVFTDPPGGDVFILDLVARLRTRTPQGEEPLLATALVLLEIESREAVAAFRQRMYRYYETLRRKHGCRVLPVALYLRVGLDGIGTDTYVEMYDDMEVLRFNFLYVGLPALDAEQYVTGGNWLGVALAALMKIPAARRAWLRAEALRRVFVECPENDYRRLLLAECIEAYLNLDDQQQLEYEQLIRTPPYQEMIPMMTTTFEKGVLQGIQKGELQGQRRAARLLLEQQFGPLNPAVEQRLNEWSAERLDELVLALRNAPSLKALGLED